MRPYTKARFYKSYIQDNIKLQKRIEELEAKLSMYEQEGTETTIAMCPECTETKSLMSTDGYRLQCGEFFGGCGYADNDGMFDTEARRIDTEDSEGRLIIFKVRI